MKYSMGYVLMALLLVFINARSLVAEAIYPSSPEAVKKVAMDWLKSNLGEVHNAYPKFDDQAGSGPAWQLYHLGEMNKIQVESFERDLKAGPWQVSVIKNKEILGRFIVIITDGGYKVAGLLTYGPLTADFMKSVELANSMNNVSLSDYEVRELSLDLMQSRVLWLHSEYGDLYIPWSVGGLPVNNIRFYSAQEFQQYIDFQIKMNIPNFIMNPDKARLEESGASKGDFISRIIFKPDFK